MKKTNIHPYWKKRIARIARKLWNYGERREGRETVEAVLRAAGHNLEVFDGLPCADAKLTRKDARRGILLYWRVNCPNDIFRVVKYVPAI